jgi:hypothetical protein
LSTDCLEKVLYDLGLLHSKQMSDLVTIDTLNTTSNLESTRNTQKTLNARNTHYKNIDYVYAMSEHDGSKAAVDKPLKNVSNNLTPVTIMVVDTISPVKSRILLKLLLDSGSTATMINRKCLPRNCKPCEITCSRQINTLAGTYTSTEVVIMRNLRLPEFAKNRNVDQQKALLFQSETCKYDVILGADFLTKTGIAVKYSTGTMEWFDSELPLRNPHLLEPKDFEAMACIVEIQQEEDLFGMDWYDPTCYAVEILDAKYEKVEVDEVTNQLTHIILQQKEDLKQILKEHTKLFDGTLGVYLNRKFHINLIPGAVANHARPYRVPVIHLAAFKRSYFT